eukprot:10765219-Lingulodinium_polyedra.AAC.1
MAFPFVEALLRHATRQLLHPTFLPQRQAATYLLLLRLLRAKRAEDMLSPMPPERGPDWAP